MELNEIRLMVDFGLVILIWLVQLIIYPSFVLIPPDKLVKWHNSYTRHISLFVAPLMLLQGGIIMLQLLNQPSVLLIVSATLYAFLWIHTFFVAVPLHNRIDRAEEIEQSCLQLIKVNKVRTILWSLIWVFALTDYLL